MKICRKKRNSYKNTGQKLSCPLTIDRKAHTVSLQIILFKSSNLMLLKNHFHQYEIQKISPIQFLKSDCKKYTNGGLLKRL